MAAGGGELGAGEGGGERGRGWDGMSAHGGETSASSALYILFCFFVFFGFLYRMLEFFFKSSHVRSRSRSVAVCARRCMGSELGGCQETRDRMGSCGKVEGAVCAGARACVRVCMYVWHRKRGRRRRRRSLNADILNFGTLLRSKRGQKSAKSPRKSDAHRLCVHARARTRRQHATHFSSVISARRSAVDG